jgi:hypothetical protein
MKRSPLLASALVIASSLTLTPDVKHSERAERIVRSMLPRMHVRVYAWLNDLFQGKSIVVQLRQVHMRLRDGRIVTETVEPYGNTLDPFTSTTTCME